MEDNKSHSPIQKEVFANGLAVTLSVTSSPPGKSKSYGQQKKTKNIKFSSSLGSRKASNDNNRDQVVYAAAVKCAIDKQLNELTVLKQRAVADIPKPPGVFSMALRMPQVLRCFRFITRRRRKYELQHCFCIWYNTKIVEYYETLIELQQRSAVVIQCFWRGFIAILTLYRRKQREAKRMLSAVSVVNRLCKVYRLRKAIRIKILERKKMAVFPMATMIQTIIRLFMGRRRYLNVVKKLLYGELRQWSGGGRVDRLLKRPGFYY